MAGERMHPLLPCRDIDEAITFYEALGFKRTYRQTRPNPHAVVNREDMHVHLFGMDGFEPEKSYGSVLIQVPDPDALYSSFADGLRAAFGKLPVAGIPRIVRPRKRMGTVYGFSVVDVGGNWLRISKLGDVEEEADSTAEKTLTHFVELAARLGDAKGDDDQALKTLESALKRFADAPPAERAAALLFRAQLALRVGRADLARASLDAVAALPLSDDERRALNDELAQTRALIADAT